KQDAPAPEHIGVAIFFHLADYPGQFMNTWVERPWVCIISLTAILACGPRAAAGDWPQFRGPNRDGVSTEQSLLKDWPADGPRLVWKATGLGAGYATISVVGNRLYTSGDSPGSSLVLALN